MKLGRHPGRVLFLLATLIAALMLGGRSQRAEQSWPGNLRISGRL